MLSVLFVTFGFSQTDSTSNRVYRIVLKDRSELVGTITGQDSLSIQFKTSGNILVAIPKDQIESVEFLSRTVREVPEILGDPNSTRLFFSPTARSLRSGQGYFSDSQLFFPMLAFGIADMVSLAGGMSLFPFASGQLIYIAPKVSPVQRENLSLAAGLLYVHPTTGNSEGFGFYYGLGTYGTRSASVTAGLGWAYSGNDVANKPVLMIGGELLASGSIKLITENWLIPDSDVNLLSLGVRFFSQSLAGDLGLIYPTVKSNGGFPFVPWIGFAYNFGPGK